LSWVPHDAASPPEFGLTVAGLARDWAVVASRTTYLPMSGTEIELLLTRLIRRLVSAAAAETVNEQAAVEVAAELVAHDFTGSSSVARSIEILANGLPRLVELQHVDQRATAIQRVLGVLAGGYAEALRQRTLNEQEQVTQALLEAKVEAERDLQVSETRFRQIFSEAAVGIALSDPDGTLVAANRGFAELVGRVPEDLIGAALPELLHTQDDPTLGAVYHELASGERTHFRHRGQLTAASGEVTWTSLSGSLLHDPDGIPIQHIIIADDITELQLLQQELSEQALHDRLTLLPNEHYFMSHLRQVLESASPSVQVTLCRVNLDNFSVINDGIGRMAGESLLCSVAGRLRDLVAGERAMVARMGNDDFAILIEDDSDRRDLSTLATNVNDQLAEPLYLDNRGIAVSGGVGIVRRPARGISANELIRAADATLHRVKRNGRGQWGLYDAQADTQQRERAQLFAEMPGAWENGEITVQYQPVCRLDSGLTVALQALLRWDRAIGMVLSHTECLALAEQTGLVVSLGRWMVQKTCRMHSQMSHEQQDRAPLLWVDLTAGLSQDPDLVAVVNDALSATGLRAEQLRLGVPMVALARKRGDVVDNVGVLAGLGVEVALLGATASPGYLAAYLEDLPVGAVEIAPDIVARVARRPGNDSVVVRAVRNAISLVHSAGATVTVPGVDTAEQAQWWRSAGADTAWGAHFGPPVPDVGLPTLFCSDLT
jgi:diguanylate cyclase (GGDEF)-like protein/PAS domain S-box-containing protein